jgi:hypothetical protein
MRRTLAAPKESRAAAHADRHFIPMVNAGLTLVTEAFAGCPVRIQTDRPAAGFAHPQPNLL